MTNLDSIFKSRDITLPTKVRLVKAGFSSSHVWMWEYKESWVQKNWCLWTVVLEKTLESPLDWKEIQPVLPKGDQSWMFTGRTDAEAEASLFWPPDVKSRLIWKDPDVGKDWRQEQKGTTEDEMVVLQEGGPLPGPKTGLLSNTGKWIVRGDTSDKARGFIGKGHPGGQQ